MTTNIRANADVGASAAEVAAAEQQHQTETQVASPPVPFINREPVAIMAVLRSGLALAVGFGFELDPQQIALIIVFVESVLMLWTRQQVTPFVSAGVTPNVQNPNETPMIQ